LIKFTPSITPSYHLLPFLKQFWTGFIRSPAVCGSLMIQRFWTQGPQLQLAANTGWDAVSGGMPQCFQTLLSISTPRLGEKAVEITWYGRPQLRALRLTRAANTHAVPRGGPQTLPRSSPPCVRKEAMTITRFWGVGSRSCDSWSSQHTVRKQALEGP
jgi:hypothetical protein